MIEILILLGFFGISATGLYYQSRFYQSERLAELLASENEQRILLIDMQNKELKELAESELKKHWFIKMAARHLPTQKYWELWELTHKQYEPVEDKLASPEQVERLKAMISGN